jgi:ATP-dependent RNA helicase DeaD
MLNMGFVEDIEKILEATNEDKRMLFFSATMPNEIMKIAKNHMKDYEVLAVKARELTTDLTDQIYFEVHEKDKFEALCRIIDLTRDFYGIVFCRTKNDANDLVGKLNDRGYDAEGLHGDISQNYREVTLKRFKAKKINVLVATDVAARGIDVNDLSHVINYSIPQEAESYVHRIGRTGRAGKEGTAITFITPQEYRRLLQIQRIVKTEIRKERVPEIKDVIQAKKFRLMEELNNILAEGNYDNFKDFAKELLNGEQALDLVAALLKHAYDDILDENNYNEISEVKLEKSGKVRLFIALGRKNAMTPKKLVDYVIKKSKVDDRKIKNVEVFENFSFMSVPFTEAEIILEAFQKDKNGKKPLVEKAKDKSNEDKSKEKKENSKRKKKENK